MYFKGQWANLICHTYFTTQYKGEPQESDEARPEWFDVDKIPYDNMWSDDIYWLPRVLKGEKLITHFEFDENNNVLSHEITVVQNFE